MTTFSLSRRNKQHATQKHDLKTGKRRRKLKEALMGYLFVLPALVATFLFGLWPVVAGFYESLKSGSPITNRYVGLDNYVRSWGSLAYVILLALGVIFLYLAYRFWRKADRHCREQGDQLWPFILPGLLAGAGIIVLGFIFVTGTDGKMWLPVTLLLLTLGGFYTANFLQSSHAISRRDLGLWWLILLGIGAAWLGGPLIISGMGLGIIGWGLLLVILGLLAYQVLPFLEQISTGHYIRVTTMMGLLLLAALLLLQYTIIQMEDTVEDAQKIAALIFNQEVLDGTVLITDDTTQISGLTFAEGEVLVDVLVDGETLQAPLAPAVYEVLPTEKITQVATTFVNQQKVQVVLPDGTLAEGQLTGIPQGEKLSVIFAADGIQAVREVDIYSALDVGEAVIRNGGYTEPFIKQILAVLIVMVGIAAGYTMTQVRRRLDDEEQPRLYDWLHYGRIALGVVLFIALFYLVSAAQLNHQAASGMGALTNDQFKAAYEYVTGEIPPVGLRPGELKAQLLYWPQVFSIMVGVFLIGVAYLIWQSAQKRETPRGFGMTILLAISMMMGGWLLIGELPRTLALGGRETEEALNSLTRTAMYSLGTVPVQLALGLFLAYLLFSEVTWGKSLFRVIYFMPYIAPSVATSTVFLVIFRLEKGSLANRAVGLFGIEPLTWLKEPAGIVRIFYEQILGGNPLNIPEALAGPSLAMTTVILYNIWVFAGYNAVVFLAGLGAIPPELYEAAEVDGAGRWSRFRNITLPLLSPTTFFLSMLSIIGTFKAFGHIYVLRWQATGKEIDTMSVHIFQTLYSANDPGYAAALAFGLFGIILMLTLVQNRLAREQVFYG